MTYTNQSSKRTERSVVEIGITAFRADLKRWLDEAKRGEEIVITDHGIAVARVIGVSNGPVIERLAREGIVTLPRSPSRVRATGRKRIPTSTSVSEMISEQRD